VGAQGSANPFALDGEVRGARPFRASHNAEGIDGGRTEVLVPTLPQYKTWIAGLYLLTIAAAVVLGSAIIAAEVLSQSQSTPPKGVTGDVPLADKRRRAARRPDRPDAPEVTVVVTVVVNRTKIRALNRICLVELRGLEPLSFGGVFAGQRRFRTIDSARKCAKRPGKTSRRVDAVNVRS
jgi:hypothetical protein